ncbi:MAG: hypothetical protein ACJAVR_002934 [Paracoccaceae bacterium]|jgi:hypothetical protein
MFNVARNPVTNRHDAFELRPGSRPVNPLAMTMFRDVHGFATRMSSYGGIECP